MYAINQDKPITIQLKTRFPLLFLLILFCVSVHAQERRAVRGRVMAANAPGRDILVVNQNALAETRTDSLGFFNIKATVGDLLIFTSHNIETKKIRYTPDIVKNNLIAIDVWPTALELDEVVVTRTNITSQSLGIPMGKKYTPAERRLRTASGFDPTVGVGAMPGVSVSFDAILNAINGRTKRLKQELEIERKEMMIEKLRSYYSNEEFFEKYKIPELNVVGFIYYCAEDAEMAKALKADNKLMADLLLSGLAADYLKLQQDAD